MFEVSAEVGFGDEEVVSSSFLRPRKKLGRFRVLPLDDNELSDPGLLKAVLWVVSGATVVVVVVVVLRVDGDGDDP